MCCVLSSVVWITHTTTQKHKNTHHGKRERERVKERVREEI